MGFSGAGRPSGEGDGTFPGSSGTGARTPGGARNPGGTDTALQTLCVAGEGGEKARSGGEGASTLRGAGLGLVMGLGASPGMGTKVSLGWDTVVSLG